MRKTDAKIKDKETKTFQCHMALLLTSDEPSLDKIDKKITEEPSFDNKDKKITNR